MLDSFVPSAVWVNANRLMTSTEHVALSTERSPSSFREQVFPSLPRVIASLLVSVAGVRCFAGPHEAVAGATFVVDLGV